MFDGIFNKKAAQQPAAVPARGPVQPRAPIASPTPTAGPMEMAKQAAIGEDFQSVVDEAAIVFAGGEEKAAGEMLILFLKQTNGQANKRVWFMLLDLYQALDQQDQYEKLCLMFATRFGTSPPSWEEAVGASASAANPVAKSATASGANVWILDVAADQVGPRIKDFIAASRAMKSCKLDMSRLNMEKSSLEGLTALLSVMAQLRKHKVAATLMGEIHVASWLEKRVEAAKAAQDPNDTPYWMLWLEILQWRGMMESFEDVSFEYTTTYEISGPGWEPSGVMTIEMAVEPEPVDAGEALSEMIVPDEIITDVSIQRLQSAISASLAEKGEAKLDFRHVRRMAFSSAGNFLNILTQLGPKGKQVILVNPSELILALSEVVGFDDKVTIVQRKR